MRARVRSLTRHRGKCFHAAEPRSNKAFRQADDARARPRERNNTLYSPAARALARSRSLNGSWRPLAMYRKTTHKKGQKTLSSFIHRHSRTHVCTRRQRRRRRRQRRQRRRHESVAAAATARWRRVSIGFHYVKFARARCASLSCTIRLPKPCNSCAPAMRCHGQKFRSALAHSVGCLRARVHGGVLLSTSST